MSALDHRRSRGLADPDHLRTGPRWLDAACARRNMGGRGGRRGGGGGRRVVPFSPADVTGLAAWYRETYAGGTWSDLSGNGRHISTLAGTPAQTTRAGQLAMSFNGSTALQGSWGSALPQPYALYIVFEQTDVLSVRYLFAGNTATGAFVLANNAIDYRVNAGASVIETSVVPATGSIRAICAVVNGASSAIYAPNNFATAAATGNAGSETMSGITAGATETGASFFVGYQWEIIAYSGAHDAATRKKIGDYFTARYSGLTVTT